MYSSVHVYWYTSYIFHGQLLVVVLVAGHVRWYCNIGAAGADANEDDADLIAS